MQVDFALNTWYTPCKPWQQFPSQKFVEVDTFCSMTLPPWCPRAFDANGHYLPMFWEWMRNARESLLCGFWSRSLETSPRLTTNSAQARNYIQCRHMAVVLNGGFVKPKKKKELFLYFSDIQGIILHLLNSLNMHPWQSSKSQHTFDNSKFKFWYAFQLAYTVQ